MNWPNNFLCCGPGDVAEAYDHATGCLHREPQTGVYVQWKGSDVCIDFRCLCGEKGHFDGLFAYALRCAACARIWEMPTQFALRENPDFGGVIQDVDFSCERPSDSIDGEVVARALPVGSSEVTDGPG